MEPGMVYLLLFFGMFLGYYTIWGFKKNKEFQTIYMTVCLFVIVLLISGGLVCWVVKKSPTIRNKLLNHYDLFWCAGFLFSEFYVGVLAGYYWVREHKAYNMEEMDWVLAFGVVCT